MSYMLLYFCFALFQDVLRHNLLFVDYENREFVCFHQVGFVLNVRALTFISIAIILELILLVRIIYLILPEFALSHSISK